MRALASDWDLFFEESLAALDEQGLLRRLRPFEGVGPKLVSPEGRELLNLCSNDYLGLAGNALLAEAAGRAARERGTGATASRLIVGSR